MKIDIVEDSFNLSINKWDEVTLEMFKAYSEYKLKTDRQNVASKTSEDSKTLKTQMFNDNELLAKIGSLCNSGGRYNNNIYRPVLDYVTERCSSTLNKGEIAILIREFYEKKGRKITGSTALLYANDYRKYIKELAKDSNAIKKALYTQETRSKAPDDTALFLNWIKTNHIINFKTHDFVDAFDNITQELAEKIISHQIHNNNVLQMGHDAFKVSKSLENSKDKGGE